MATISILKEASFFNESSQLIEKISLACLETCQWWTFSSPSSEGEQTTQFTFLYVLSSVANWTVLDGKFVIRGKHDLCVKLNCSLFLSETTLSVQLLQKFSCLS